MTQPAANATDQSLQLMKVKGIVERRIRDVESQLNKVCESVFGAGEVIEFYNDADKLKVRGMVQQVIENVVVTNIETAYQKLHITASKIVQAGFSDGVFRAEIFADIMQEAENVARGQQQANTNNGNGAVQIKTEQEANTETVAIDTNTTASTTAVVPTPVKPKTEPTDEMVPVSGPSKKRKLDHNDSTQQKQIKVEVKIEDEAVADAPSGRVINLRFKCSVKSCGQIFNYQEAFDGHMLSKHRIKKYRCHVKNCRSSFTSTAEFCAHRVYKHVDLTSWPCGKCDKSFPNPTALSTHHNKNHIEGQFACGYVGCDFVSNTNRKEVFNHQKEHITTKLTCPEAACGKMFKSKSGYDQHMSLHRDVKPYLCKWPECNMASNYKGSVITHVRTQHFKLPSTQKEQKRLNIIDNRNPHDYVLQLQ